ncbi:MAG: polymer-forming cytoskeletal protein [Clostridium sp.]|nr:polymer-forming cytoskeletal protein [Clostridium sp.]
MEEKLSDMKISGSGIISGGKYNEVKISGSGKIDGDIECNFFKVSGSSSASGNIKAKIFGISGSIKVDGNLDTEDFKISGSSHVLGDVNAKNVKISGSSHIDGSLHAEDIKISGSTTVDADCEAENFTVRGGFRIGGLLNAGTIDAEIYGGCKVKDIGGENIKIKPGPGHFFMKMINLFSNHEVLEADTIEGDEIYLENTNAKIVRGNNVTIGANCNIERVEYRNTVNIDKNSNIVCKKIS